MDYTLKNGKTLTVREPRPDDAAAIIALIRQADTETRFLARNPSEFSYTVEEERELIEKTLADGERTWFVAEYEGRHVGNCSVGLVRGLERYRHRASVAFIVLKAFTGLGIGGRLMEECIRWAREHSVLQLELSVVTTNERALRMYRSFGFEVTVPRALRYSDGTFADELIMVKRLDET